MKWLNAIAQFFNTVFSKKKTNDYTVLTTEERESLRLVLNKILKTLFALVADGELDGDAAAKAFIDLQRDLGEEHKTYNDKLDFLGTELKKYEEA